MATLALGTMNFGRRTPEPEARRLVDAALANGITEFDTANLYGDGESERLLGKALGGRAAKVTTKVGAHRKEGLSRARVVQSLDESLKRLGLDAVDTYLWHLPDPKTPIDESLDGIAEVLEAKKARAWGVSNFSAWQLLELIIRCDARGVPRPSQSQVLYNLAVRQLDVEYAGFVAKYPVRTVVYNPLAGGLLAHDPGVAPSPSTRLSSNALYARRYGSAVLRAQAAQWKALAVELGLELPTLAYAFVLQRSFVDVVLTGPATVAQLEVALRARSTVLDPAQLERIDALSRALSGTDASYAR